MYLLYYIFFLIIYMLPISLHMGRAILKETYTSAPYRPGHWLLCDVTPEPQVYRPSPLPPSPLPLPSPSPYWFLCGSRHHTVWPLIVSFVHFTPVLYISPHGQLVGGTYLVPFMRGPLLSLCLGEGVGRGQVKGGGGWR